MQVNANMSVTTAFDPPYEPLEPIDSEPNDGIPSDDEAEQHFCEDRLIRLWYSVFSDSFVD